MAELADAEGLNPSGPQGPCGFESRPGHSLTTRNVVATPFGVDLGPDLATGKRRQYDKQGFPTKKAAEAALDPVLADVREGTAVGRRLPRRLASGPATATPGRVGR